MRKWYRSLWKSDRVLNNWVSDYLASRAHDLPNDRSVTKNSDTAPMITPLEHNLWHMWIVQFCITIVNSTTPHWVTVLWWNDMRWLWPAGSTTSVYNQTREVWCAVARVVILLSKSNGKLFGIQERQISCGSLIFQNLVPTLTFYLVISMGNCTESEKCRYHADP